MLTNALSALVNRDIKLYARKGGELMSSAGFFLVALSLFPLGMGDQLLHLDALAPGLIWVVLLLASLLSAPILLDSDQRDGSLDQLRISGVAMEWIIVAKCIANWVGCLLPLVLLSTLASYLLGMQSAQSARLCASLLLATPLLPLLAMMGASLTLQAAAGHGLLALLVLPLYIPVLIFATAVATSTPDNALLSQAETLFLLGLDLVFLPLSCVVSAWLVRIQQ